MARRERNEEISYRRSIILKHEVTAAEQTANAFVIEVNSGTLPTDSFGFVGQIKDSAGVEKPGFKWTYSTATGCITCADDGTADLASGSIATVVGTYFS